MEDRWLTRWRVAVWVAFSPVHRRPSASVAAPASQVRTVTNPPGPPDEHLESVLGATSHEFESRILAAAWALGLGSAGQTLGRNLYTTLASRIGITSRTVALITLGGVTTAAFAMVSGPFPPLVGIAIAAGAVRGNLTLLQATAITDRRGTTHYGRLSGLLAAPATIASALAPFAGAALADPLGGYPGLFAVLVLVSAAAALFAGRTPHHPQHHGRTPTSPQGVQGRAWSTGCPRPPPRA
ncbi:MFS transporter [Streptomyces sp. Ag109_O5-10]|uniref:MFS transporter n=1 Tax=Streptomyces sp. Ag109_O5-10 TaxID=1855349 RepID=UPI00210B2933|nr:MFS transporter [Streptomyces sp. Ag109_O5-10]